jgi:DNA primase
MPVPQREDAEFNVSPNLGIYKCFGCGESGDSITFLQKHEHLSYVEAIRWLAKRYNIDLPEEEQTPEQQVEQSERESLAVVQQWAMAWSVEQLWNTDEGKRIGLSYFHERGFSDATIRTFQLGYVPEFGNAFTAAATAHGFNPEMLEKAGWIKRRDDGSGSAWDFFAGRVTFPIHGSQRPAHRLRCAHAEERQEAPQVLQQSGERALQQEPLALRHPPCQEAPSWSSSCATWWKATPT